MQPLHWYVRRLQSMSATELLWRVRSTVRDVCDRPRFALGLYPSHPPMLVPSRADSTKVDVHIGGWGDVPIQSSALGSDLESWNIPLRKRADKILNHTLSFFSLPDCHVGETIDWNRDHECGKKAPLGFASSIDYRDYRVTGDAKIVWEPNRHHHLVVLARAYALTRDQRYAAGVVAQLTSWFDQCPFGYGMNWRSPLELAIRLINWMWAIDLIADSEVITPEFRMRLLANVYLHLWEITRKYSQASSANNHRVGEAAGVFIATSYFPQLDEGGNWNRQSWDILAEEIHTQTYADGANREQAFGYHLFVLQFFLFAGIMARRGGRDFPTAYWQRVEQMMEFAGAISAGGDRPLLYGDCDDGYVLDLGNTPSDVASLLSVGAVLFNRSDFKSWGRTYSELAYWLFGAPGRKQWEAIAVSPEKSLVSRAFPDSGYYLLQAESLEQKRSVSVVFDCGELGFGSIAAHGHADALSFILRAGGHDVFVDPGTYDYFRYPQFRNYFRSTRAHNTVMLDDTDQSEMLGPFLWGARANARCLTWEPRDNGGRVSGEHDGYTRLEDSVLHRRTLDLDGEFGLLTIQDDIEAQGQHEVAIFFHLAEDCEIREVGAHRYKITVHENTVVLQLDEKLKVDILTGSEEPISGWVSRQYHQKRTSATIVCRSATKGSTRFVSTLSVNAATDSNTTLSR